MRSRGSQFFLTCFGFNVEKIPVSESGIVDLKKLKSLLSNDVLLVSIMTMNNEIGTNQPIKEIGKLCVEHDVLFHTDASRLS
jgi:cysteine desulfurase